jgi:hypothetical protein
MQCEPCPSLLLYISGVQFRFNLILVYTVTMYCFCTCDMSYVLCLYRTWELCINISGLASSLSLPAEAGMSARGEWLVGEWCLSQAMYSAMVTRSIIMCCINSHLISWTIWQEYLLITTNISIWGWESSTTWALAALHYECVFLSACQA